MEFVDFKPTQSVESDNSVYADVVNHCKNYRPYLVSGSISSSVHEITHCINSDLRNGAIEKVEIPLNTNTKICCLTKPLITTETNAFYALENRAIRLNEPNCRKRDFIQFIPSSFKGPRYSLYVEGQREWDGQPLYLFDEWMAYQNGAVATIDLIKRNKYKEGSSDYIYGPLEFVAYCVATAMAANKANSLEQKLIEFITWQLQRVFNIYFEGKGLLPWDEMDKCYERLKSGSEANDLRSFMKEKLNFTVPDGPGPAPKPDEDVDFYV